MGAILHLGPVELTARPVEAFTGASQLHAWRTSEEPSKSAVLLSALAVAAAGPSDWPRLRESESYAVHGQRVRRYLGAMGAPLDQALAAGMMAIEAIARKPGVTDEQVEEYADFFGVPLDGGPDAGSPSDTRDQHSEG